MNGYQGSCTLIPLTCFHSLGSCDKQPEYMDSCREITYIKSIADTSQTSFCVGAGQSASVSTSVEIGVVAGSITGELSAAVEFSKEFCKDAARSEETGIEDSRIIPGIPGVVVQGCARGKQINATWTPSDEKMTLVSYAGQPFAIHYGDDCPEPHCEYSPSDAARKWRDKITACDFFESCPEPPDDDPPAGSTNSKVVLLVVPCVQLAAVLVWM